MFSQDQVIATTCVLDGQIVQIASAYFPRRVTIVTADSLRQKELNTVVSRQILDNFSDVMLLRLDMWSNSIKYPNHLKLIDRMMDWNDIKNLAQCDKMAREGKK